MGVKRVTIEMDDSADMAKSTVLPESVFGKKPVTPTEAQDTGTPEEQEAYRGLEAFEKGQSGAQVAETIGRTPSDLVFTFIKSPQFMPTFFTVLSFIIFNSELKNITDFWRPIVTAIIFNVVWFSVRTIFNLFKKK